MLPLPRFELHTPDRLEDVLAMAGQPGVKLLAGGTDLLPSMKHRLFAPEHVVSLARTGLDGIREEGGDLVIGATATLERVAAAATRYPGLVAACRTVATPTIQGMATLGGNVLLDTRCLYYNQPDGWRQAIGGCLKANGDVCRVAPKGPGCVAAHAADTVPALWLYGARLRLASTAGTREIPTADLYKDDGQDWHALRPGEVLTAVVLPAPGDPVVHRKVRPRGAIDYAMLLVAVQKGPQGTRAVLSALGPRPLLVEAPASELAEAAWRAATPMNTHAWSVGWRKHMVRVEVSRALEQLP